MFRKLSLALYQATQQQLLSTLKRTQQQRNIFLQKSRNVNSNSIAANFFRYEQPIASSINKKITIVGSEKSSLPMALKCLDRDLCSQICIMDCQSEGLNLGKKMSNSDNPHIRATKNFHETKDSDLIILTKDMMNPKDKCDFGDSLQQNTNIMKQFIPQLVKYSPNTIILIDTEQAEVMTYVAWKLSRLPKNRVLNPKHKLIQQYANQVVQPEKPNNFYYTKPKDEYLLNPSTDDVAATIIANYHRILLSTLPPYNSETAKIPKPATSNVDGHVLFRSSFCKVLTPQFVGSPLNLKTHDFTNFRKFII